MFVEREHEGLDARRREEMERKKCDFLPQSGYENHEL